LSFVCRFTTTNVFATFRASRTIERKLISPSLSLSLSLALFLSHFLYKQIDFAKVVLAQSPSRPSSSLSPPNLIKRDLSFVLLTGEMSGRSRAFLWLFFFDAEKSGKKAPKVRTEEAFD
jgi:hypothetical protein